MTDHSVVMLGERLCMVTIEVSLDKELFELVELYVRDVLEMTG